MKHRYALLLTLFLFVGCGGGGEVQEDYHALRAQAARHMFYSALQDQMALTKTETQTASPAGFAERWMPPCTDPSPIRARPVLDRDWISDLSSIRTEIKEQARGAIVVVYAPGCSSCEKFANDCKSTVKELYRGRFVLGYTSDTVKSVKFFPTTIVTDPNGKTIAHFKGYSDKSSYLDKLRKAVESER